MRALIKAGADKLIEENAAAGRYIAVSDELHDAMVDLAKVSFSWTGAGARLGLARMLS